MRSPKRWATKTNPCATALMWRLRKLGFDAPSLIPGLIVTLGYQDVDTVRQAALTLADLGEDAVPALQDALTGGNQMARKGAAYALGNIPELGPAGVAQLQAIVADQRNELDLRRVAASSLALLGQDMQPFFAGNQLVSPQNAVCPPVVYWMQCRPSSNLTLSPTSAS